MTSPSLLSSRAFAGTSAAIFALCASLLSEACGASQKPVSEPVVEPAPAPAEAPAATEAQASGWDDFVAELIEASFRRNPLNAAWQGRHEFDGQVQDLSQSALAKDVAELKAELARAKAFDAQKLSERERFERDYVVANLEGELFWAERIKQHTRTPLFYMNAVDPSLYLTRNYAPEEQRLKAYISHLRQVPRVVAQMKENLALPLPKTFVEVGVQVWGGLGPYIEKDVPPIFKAVSDATLQSELAEASKTAAAAAKDATAWLESQKASATGAYALGAETFREMLWTTERVDTPLAELEAVGRKDLEANLAALKEACEKVLPKKPVEACITKVNNEKHKAGPVLGAREQLTSLRAFVKDQSVVSIPTDEEALVEEAPPYKRWNQAYIEIPGPYEKGLPSIYYIAPPDPKWSKADQKAYIPGEKDLLFISVHEVWPGHFLQYLHAKTSDRMFGRLFVGYAFAEGWAHYSEEMMWEAGLQQGDDKARVGQLLNALLRNVRFLSAIGLHTQGMKVEDSERMFREQAFQDPGNARQQAARGTFDPGYLNYTLGKLMIRKMRADYCEPRGGRTAWRDFHDALLSYGGPPLPLVRKRLIGEGGALL
jgi:uncharacterized protein (DUF885 family)